MSNRQAMYNDTQKDHEYKKLLIDNIADELKSSLGLEKKEALAVGEAVLDRVLYERLFHELF